MDKLSGLASKATGGNKDKPAGGAAGGDYGDKGLEAAEKKFGMSQSKETNEKVTDGARDFIEKQTGKDIPDKVSN